MSHIQLPAMIDWWPEGMPRANRNNKQRGNSDMNMIEISYRAAVLQNEEVRRTADKVGRHLVELRERKSRRQPLHRRIGAIVASSGADIRAMLATSVRRLRPAEG